MEKTGHCFRIRCTVHGEPSAHQKTIYSCKAAFIAAGKQRKVEHLPQLLHSDRNIMRRASESSVKLLYIRNTIIKVEHPDVGKRRDQMLKTESSKWKKIRIRGTSRGTEAARGNRRGGSGTPAGDQRAVRLVNLGKRTNHCTVNSRRGEEQNETELLAESETSQIAEAGHGDLPKDAVFNKMK